MVPTLADIAQEVGVSRQAVSAVLTGGAGTTRVSSGTRRRVLHVARVLGYRPNAAARGIRRGHFGNIALLAASNTMYSYLPPALLWGIERELARRDLRLLISHALDEQLSDEEFVPAILREWSADGLLVNYQYHFPQPMRELLSRYRLPCVWINSRWEADCVYTDDADAALRATRFLLERGARRIAYVDFAHTTAELAQKHFSVRERQAGYERAMAEAGRQPVVVRPGAGSGPAQDRAMAALALLGSADRPEAILGYAESAVRPLVVAALRLRLDVPTQLPMAAFADAPMDVGGVRLPTLVVPQHALGETAVQMLLTRLRQPAEPLSPIILPIPFDARPLTSEAAAAPPAVAPAQGGPHV